MAQRKISREKIKIHKSPKTPPEHYNRNSREYQTKVGAPLFLYLFLRFIHAPLYYFSLVCKNTPEP